MLWTAKLAPATMTVSPAAARAGAAIGGSMTASTSSGFVTSGKLSQWLPNRPLRDPKVISVRFLAAARCP